MDDGVVWIPIIGILGSSATVVLVVWFVARARQRRAEVQAEVQVKLIDRFGTAPELIEFLQSPSGRAFISGVQSAPAVLARERVAGALTRSIVLTALGLAFMFLMFFQREDGWAVPASILLFLGLGYFIATIVSYRLTSKMNADAAVPLGTNNSNA
jgi:hypothetical protein